MGEMGVNAAWWSACSGSSVAETETKDPNSPDEVEKFLECGDDFGFVLEVTAVVPNAGTGNGEAGGVGGEKRGANKSSFPSCSSTSGWVWSNGGLGEVGDINNTRSPQLGGAKMEVLSTVCATENVSKAARGILITPHSRSPTSHKQCTYC